MSATDLTHDDDDDDEEEEEKDDEMEGNMNRTCKCQATFFDNVMIRQKPKHLEITEMIEGKCSMGKLRKTCWMDYAKEWLGLGRMAHRCTLKWRGPQVRGRT